MSRARDIGTRAETALCRYLTDQTGIAFERGPLRGRFDRGDIHAHDVPVTIETKATKTPNLRRWGAELAAECVNNSTIYGAVIWSPPGVGTIRIDQWIAIEWAATGLTPTRTRRIPHVGPINQLHRYVAQADQWGPVIADPTGRTPTPGDNDWIRLQHLDHWTAGLQNHLATITAVTTTGA